jgi:predicted dehydrogenase
MISVDLFANKIFEATHDKFDDGSFVHESGYSKRDHLLLEHKHFYHSILEGVKPVISLNDGLNAVHLVDCALKSIEFKKKVMVTSLE